MRNPDGRDHRPPSRPGAPVAGRLQLVLLLAGSCMAVLGSVLIAPVLPQMATEFAGTPGVDLLVPIALTVPALMIGLTAPFAGIIVDAIDRKRLLIAAMVVYSVVGTAPLYLDSLGAIVASRVGVGLCEAAIMTCCTTLIGDYWNDTNGSAASSTNTGTSRDVYGFRAPTGLRCRAQVGSVTARAWTADRSRERAA